MGGSRRAFRADGLAALQALVEGSWLAVIGFMPSAFGEAASFFTCT